MKIDLGNAQNMGNRKEQQDDFGFSSLGDRGLVARGGIVGVVCDGMGGLSNGGEAAQLAKLTFLNVFSEQVLQEDIPSSLKAAALAANNEVRRYASQIGEEGNCGSTLVAATVHGGTLYWISVGDSRIYLYENGVARLITDDHIYANKLKKAVENGFITAEEADKDVNKEALTSFIGIEELTEICEGQTDFHEGMAVILCSDGLSKVLNTKEIAGTFAPVASAWADKLVKAVLKKNLPHQDNVTVALIMGKGAKKFGYDYKDVNDSGKRTQKFKKIAIALLLFALLLMTAVFLVLYTREDIPEPKVKDTPVLSSDQISEDIGKN